MSIADKITRLQNAKTAIATAITDKGGTVSTGDGFEAFAADIATIPAGAGVTEVATEAEMDSYLVEANVGKYYKFTGTTTSKYTQGSIYLVREESDDAREILVGATINGINATGFHTYTGQTTTTYKYHNSDTCAFVKSETVTENNRLRYWLHVPFNYNPNNSYRLITYMDGVGSAMFTQDNYNDCSTYNRLNLSYFASDTATIPEIKNSYHLLLLSGAVWNAQHTGYIDSAYNFENDTIYTARAAVKDGESGFLERWLGYVLLHPSYDAFMLIPQHNDSIWLEGRAKYNIDGTDCILLDVSKSYYAGYGEHLSDKDYGNSYLVSLLPENPQSQLVKLVQDLLMQKYSINPKQLTIMGFSMGGCATYDYISRYPTRYATAITACTPSIDVSNDNLTPIVGTKIKHYFGASDDWIAADAFGATLVTRFTALGGDATSTSVNCGHSIQCFVDNFDDIMTFIYSNSRD